MIFSASAVMAKERYGSAYEFLVKQLIWAVAGLFVMAVAMKIDYKRLQTSGARFFVARIYNPSAYIRVFSGACARYASVVSCRADFVAALGTCQARAHSVSRLVPGK